MTTCEFMERLNAAISEYGDIAVAHEGGGRLSEPRLHLDADALGGRTLVITGNVSNEDED